jgi:high-affinity iron transporter
MNLGAAVLTFREGLEAALIVAILMGYLRKIGRPDVRKYIWAGVGAALALTVGFVLLLQLVGAEFEYPAKGFYEGVTSLLAVGMVTYMTFWMARQGRHMKGHLEDGVRASLATGRGWGLFALAFLAVIREGVETALFLSAAVFASSGIATLTGGVAGLLVSIGVAAAIYVGGVRLDLRRFFQVAGVLLVVFGAAILRYGVHEFEEIGLLPPLVERVWNTGGALPEGTGLGAVLQALIGYTSKPSLMQLIAYFGYFVIVGLALWRPWARGNTTPPRRGQETTSTTNFQEVSA